MAKKILIALAAIMITCGSAQERAVYQVVGDIIVADSCIQFATDKGTIETGCRNEVNCLIQEGTVLPPGTPSQDYQEQEGNSHDTENDFVAPKSDPSGH